LALERSLLFPLLLLLGAPVIIIGGYVNGRGLTAAKTTLLMTGWLMMAFGWRPLFCLP
jgi:hypothetical protein